MRACFHGHGLSLPFPFLDQSTGNQSPKFSATPPGALRLSLHCFTPETLQPSPIGKYCKHQMILVKQQRSFQALLYVLSSSLIDKIMMYILILVIFGSWRRQQRVSPLGFNLLSLFLYFSCAVHFNFAYFIFHKILLKQWFLTG